MRDFDRRIREADLYLQLMIDNVNTLQADAAKHVDRQRTFAPMLQSANVRVCNMHCCEHLFIFQQMVNTIKHAIVVMQLAKCEIAAPNSGGSAGVSLEASGSSLQSCT